MTKWFAPPKASASHHAFRDVCIQHGGQRRSAAWHVEGGRLFVGSAWGSTSEPISDDTDPTIRASELLRGMVAARGAASDKPRGA
jgi:hypothetical protein